MNRIGPALDAPPCLFRIPSFSAALATNLLGVFVAVGYFLFIAQSLQLVRGLSPLESALWSLPSAVAFVLSSNVVPRFIRRLRPVWVLGSCLLLAASVVVSLAMTPLFSLTTELIVGSTPPERAGAASAISETGAEVGGTVGIAVLGSIGTTVYRGIVQSGLPAGIPPEAAHAARDTLGGAGSVAQLLSPDLAREILELTRQAFVHGFHLVAGISAVIAVAAAAIAVAMLRRLPAGTGAEGRGEHSSAQAAGK